jgi:hypothetical protein
MTDLDRSALIGQLRLNEWTEQDHPLARCVGVGGWRCAARYELARGGRLTSMSWRSGWPGADATAGWTWPARSRGVRKLLRFVGHYGTPGSGSDRRAPLPSRAPPGEPGQGRSDPPAIRPSSPSRKAALLYLPEPFQVAAQPPDVGPGAILRDPVEVLRAREFEERKIVLAGNEHRRGWAIVWRICIKWLHRGRATHAAIRRETKRIN